MHSKAFTEIPIVPRNMYAKVTSLLSRFSVIHQSGQCRASQANERVCETTNFISTFILARSVFLPNMNDMSSNGKMLFFVVVACEHKGDDCIRKWMYM